MDVRFEVLGPFTARADVQDITPTSPKLRTVLALLLVHGNQLVSTDDLIDEIWGTEAPPSAKATLHTYIHKLRRILSSFGLDAHGCFLHTKYLGYLLEVPPGKVDFFEFEQMADQGAKALAEGDAQRAATVLRAGLAMWRGPILGGVRTGSTLTARAAGLQERYLRALEMRVEADLRLGRHAELIRELSELVVRLPASESFHGSLMVALSRSQRRHEALALYREFRRRMIEEFGLEPSPAIQRIHQATLTDEPGDSPGQKPLARPGFVTVPAQLPADIADFSGRRDLLLDSMRWLAPDAPDRDASRVLSISGMPGIGKTTFAIRLAQRLRSQFVDGQLFATLRASGPVPRDPTDVLASLLRGVGMQDENLPEDPDERATLFRSWAAVRRVLIVLDDASTATQVQPLLPAGARCSVIVTSRCGLQSLPGAHPVRLDPFRAEESLQLLGTIGGTELIAGQQPQAAELTAMCGQLPLAVRCLGARLSAMRSLSLHDTLAQFATRRKLDLLRSHDLSVRDRLASCYRMLPNRLRSAFPVLAKMPEGPFGPAAAAAVLGIDSTEAGEILIGFVERGVLDVAPSPAANPSFALHPLMRCYAEELADESLVSTTNSQPACRTPLVPEG